VYKKSKCLRAFDRRPSGPSGVVIGGQPPAHRQVHHGDMASTSGRPNRSPAERTSSPEESSSSGDHGHPSQAAGESENMEMAVDNDPLWPWDQLIELNPEME
jgi:hypothetical protein